MTIGTPLWDEFVANLKEVKVTVEDMGFMPDNFPCESELKSMTAQQMVDIEHQFIEYYKRYAFMSTKIVHNDMYVKVKKVNEEVRALYYRRNAIPKILLTVEIP